MHMCTYYIHRGLPCVLIEPDYVSVRISLQVVLVHIVYIHILTLPLN